MFFSEDLRLLSWIVSFTHLVLRGTKDSDSQCSHCDTSCYLWLTNEVLRQFKNKVDFSFKNMPHEIIKKNVGVGIKDNNSSK